MWSISTILHGLYSFMIETNPTLGSIETTYRKKRQYASQSLEYNVRDKTFCKLFPEYVERYEKERAEKAASSSNNNANSLSKTTASSQQVAFQQALVDGFIDMPFAATFAGLVAILSIVVMLCRFM